MAGAGQPSGLNEGPFIPSPEQNLMFEGFNGLNTNASRPGIEDDQCSWMDGWMPLGKNFLRTIPDVGDSIYTAPTSTSIVYYSFYNIGAQPYAAVFNADGSVHQVNTVTTSVTTIAPVGTISSPSLTTLGVSQWGNQYLLFVAAQENGYWAWDGSLLYGAGTISPDVTITNGGSGYTVAPTVSFSGTYITAPTGTAVVAGGFVVGVSVTGTGVGIPAGDTVSITFSGGGGSSAAAVVGTMPYGVSGTALETYQERVWITSVSEVSFTAPGTFTDFATSDGGGSFFSTDSFLRTSFIQPIQTNGFLYLIADSSVNYISGVQTTGSPPTTTFVNQNADPEIGTPWATTVDTFSRNILFANAFGVQVSYGGAVTKISEMLDGVYNSVANFDNFIPSSAKAIIFGKKVWMLLLPVIDAVTGLQVNKLFMWNGKLWWSTEQGVNLVFVNSQEINSILTAYGTDGKHIYPLFQSPSNNFTKTVQSKLWDKPTGYHENKVVTRLWGIVNCYSNDVDLFISVDNETDSGGSVVEILPALMIWTTATDEVMNWVTAGDDIMNWSLGTQTNLVIPQQTVAQQGALLGLTVTTESADVALVSLMLGSQSWGYRG